MDSRRHRRAAGLTAAAAALVVGLGACGKPDAPPPPPPAQVSVVTVDRKTIDVEIPRVAQVESSREVEVVARVSGFH